jgi:PAS domain S-box-containing protein
MIERNATDLEEKDQFLKRRDFVAELDAADDEIIRTCERLNGIAERLGALGDDPDQNIQDLTTWCGELFGAACASYNRFQEGILSIAGNWRLPEEEADREKPDGLPCYDAAPTDETGVSVILDLANTIHGLTDPYVLEYGFRTYMGCRVNLDELRMGFLCLFFRADYVPTRGDKSLLRIVAGAIAGEERRRQAADPRGKPTAQPGQSRSDIPVMALWLDANSTILDANSKLLEHTGYSMEELRGKPAGFLLTPRSASRAIHWGFSQLWEEAALNDAPAKCARKNGKPIDVLIDACVTSGGSGSLTGMLVLWDVTEHKRVREALRQARNELEERAYELSQAKGSLKELESIINKGPAVVFLWINEQGWPVQLVSENIRRFGYEPEDFLSRRLDYFNMVHPKDRQNLAEDAAFHCDAGVDEFTQNYRVITRAGKVRSVEVVTSVRRDQSGRPNYFLGIVTDVTDRARAEHALHVEKLKLRSLADTFPEGLAVLEKTGEFDYVNAKFTEIFGYTCEDASDIRTWLSKARLSHDARRQAEKAWSKALKAYQPDGLPRTNLVVKCKDGVEKTACFTPLQFMCDDSPVTFMVCEELEQAGVALSPDETETRE